MPARERRLVVFERVAQWLQIVAVFALPHRHGRNIIWAGAIIDPGKGGDRRLHDPEDRLPAAGTASFRVAQFCHGSAAASSHKNVRAQRFEQRREGWRPVHHVDEPEFTQLAPCR